MPALLRTKELVRSTGVGTKQTTLSQAIRHKAAALLQDEEQSDYKHIFTDGSISHGRGGGCLRGARAGSQLGQPPTLTRMLPTHGHQVLAGLHLMAELLLETGPRATPATPHSPSHLNGEPEVRLI